MGLTKTTDKKIEDGEKPYFSHLKRNTDMSEEMSTKVVAYFGHKIHTKLKKLRITACFSQEVKDNCLIFLYPSQLENMVNDLYDETVAINT